MRSIDVLRLRLRSLLRRSRLENDLSAELSFHLEQQIAENISAGMAPDDARHAALRAIGNLESFKEECRDARGSEWVSALLRDIRYGIRTLRKDRGFAAVAILSLAAGIGVNSALFSVVDAILLKSLPVSEPERLVAIDRVNPRGEKDNFSYPLFEEIRDRAPVFSGVFAALHGTDRIEAVLPGGQTTVEADLRLVSAEYFEVLGVRPAIGQVLTRQDHVRAASVPTVVISHRFWKSRFDEDPLIIGKTVTIGKRHFTVVGVTAPGFFGEAAGQAPDFWAPLECQPMLSGGLSRLDKPNVSWLKVMARLAPGVDAGNARAALQALFERLKREPGRAAGSVKQIQGLELSSGQRGLDDLRRAYSQPLRVLMLIVGVVLLIACANVANLLLARGAQREHELSIRLALGAKRTRIIRQLMTENMLLAASGAGLGVLFAIWTTKSLLLLVSQRAEPLPLQAGIDARVLLFTALVSIASCLVFGLVPAIQSTRSRNSLSVSAARRPRQLLHRALVSAQVAMSVALVTGAGLFALTLHYLRSQDLGFQQERLLQVRIDAESNGYKPSELPAVYERILTAIRSAPGVMSASLSHSGFNTGISRTCCIAIEEHPFPAGAEREVRTNSVEPGYFETVGLPLLLGRRFISGDIADSPRVVILNRAASQRYFGMQSAIGKRIGWGDPPKVSYNIEVIGVVEDLKIGNLREEMRPILYFPANAGRVLHVRTGMGAAAAAATVRQAIVKADSNVTIHGVHTINSIIAGSLVVEKLMATMAGFFGALALSLAVVGIYGVIDYWVKRRTQEIGVRMALGAQPSSIVGMISRNVASLVAPGIVLGAILTLPFDRLIGAMLFGIEASNGLNLAIAAGTLGLAGALAAVIPSRRAASITPSTALRYE